MSKKKTTSYYPNRYIKQKVRGVKRKLEVINLFGGKCIRCGYDRNLAALQFHHRPGEVKLYNVDLRAFANTEVDKILDEARKCDLLCNNCHVEEHNEWMNIDYVNEILKENSNITSMSTRSGKVCSRCGSRFPKALRKGDLCPECLRIRREEILNSEPKKDELLKSYEDLGSWRKVANKYGITTRVLQRIRKSVGI